jgi:hypothetical protein
MHASGAGLFMIAGSSDPYPARSARDHETSMCAHRKREANPDRYARWRIIMQINGIRYSAGGVQLRRSS